MELAFLVLAIGGLFTDSDTIQASLLVAHCLFGAWTAWKLKATQPLTALFALGYPGMYFLNPLAIHLGIIERDSTEYALVVSNALMMMGLDLFIVGARRLRFTDGDFDKLPRFEMAEGRVDIAIVVCIGIYVVATAFHIIGVGSLDSTRSAFELQRFEISGEGEHNIFFLVARYASFSLPFASFLIALKRPGKQIIFLLPLAALVLEHIMLFRVRQGAVAVAFAYVVGMVARHLFVTLRGTAPSGRLPIHLRVGLIAAIPAIAILAVSIRWVRAMYATGQYDFSTASMQEMAGKTFSGGDLGVAYMTRMAVEKFPSEHPYLNGLSVYRLFLTPIPRFIWPDKPQTTQRIFSAVLDPKRGGSSLTIPAGVVGDLHVNFGPWGVLGMVVIGFFFGLERYRTLTSLMVLASCGVWIFHYTRGAQTGPLLSLIVTWLMAKALNYGLAPTAMPRTAQSAWQYAYYAPAATVAAMMSRMRPRRA